MLNNEKSTKLSNKSDITLVNIINYLMSANWDSAYNAIETYLNQLKKREYIVLINNLIKICILENDLTFIRPLKALSAIYLDDFDFNIENYINEFYLALAENNSEKVKLYIEIIEFLAKLSKDYQLPSDFLQRKDINSNEKEQKHEQEENDSKEKYSNLKCFVDEQCQTLLKEKGVIILGPYKTGKRKQIHKLTKDYPDIVTLNVGASPNRYILLRYKPTIEEYIDIREIISLANSAYHEKKYKRCIDYYLQVLQIGKPKAIAYIRLGLSYLYLGNISKAINYLKIAQEVSRKEEKQYDFTEFIEELKANLLSDDKKRYFDMEIKDFTESNDGFNFDEIYRYILETNLDVETACKNLGFNEELINIIKLTFAKKYYSQGSTAKGDLFLKSVEKSEHKSRKVLELIEELKRNKRLYKTKNNPERILILSLKPKS